MRRLLSALTTTYPDLQKHLFSEQNKLRNFVNVYVNEDNIRQKNGLETSLAPNDTIMIVPSIAGGSPAVAEAQDNSILPELSHDEITRYSRHLILPEVGMEGQKKTKK